MLIIKFMVNFLEAVLLGVVQGLTEWLPVSSSGHLVIVQQLFGIQVPLLFDIALHVGTLLAVLAFLWKDVLKIVSAFLKFDFKSDDGKMGLFILVGSVPVALAGFFLHDFVESLFSSLSAVGAALVVMGSILYSTKFFKNGRGMNGEREMNGELNAKNALLIGISQAISIIPGISRSGITISSALYRNIGKQKAFVFSFLLSIPAVLGAAVFEVVSSSLGFSPIDFGMIFGAAIAASVGYLSLKLMRNIVDKERFYLFAYYCWLVGAAILVYKLL